MLKYTIMNSFLWNLNFSWLTNGTMEPNDGDRFSKTVLIELYAGEDFCAVCICISWSSDSGNILTVTLTSIWTKKILWQVEVPDCKRNI
jgi:hypothetical protein